jgi:DNA helicase-2/ATP-dependent DNA helicase PcrA
VSEYLNQLSEVQREAAVNYQGPALIVAGAGSGKTRVLICRIAHMISEGVNPSQVLALTFTNKAAREMKERIGRAVSEEKARRLWMGTFHSVFARILRNEADKLGYPSSFTIYDTSDSRNVVRSIVKEMNLNEDYYKPNDIFARISLAKNNLVTAAAYEANPALVAEDVERRRPQFAEVYKLYVRRCKGYGAMDFDDLLLNMNLLFRDFPDVLTRCQQQFRYVLVDEYQDTNTAQYLIVRRIAEQHRNICVVGDDAQSIYSFRGAKIENILRFQHDYPQTGIFKLEQNYRSTPTIVNAANSVIEKNKRQLPKKVFSKNTDGEKIRVCRSYTDQEEALIVASDVFQKLRKGEVESYNELAILYRTNAQSRALEEAFRRRGIPYRIYGGQSFYQRKEVKDVLAYVRLVVNHQDDEALRRIVNYPARGIGDVTLNRIADAARERGISLWAAMEALSPAEMGLNGGAARKVADFFATVQELSAQINTLPAYELGMQIALRSGIIGSFKMQQTPEATSALENIDELLGSIASYVESRQEGSEGVAVTIDDWLQNIALLTDMDANDEDRNNRATLMTVHSAKGLEFDYIYIVGLEENLFPSQMSNDTLEGIEEERRLFYVALTRARKGAVLTFSQTRFRWGQVTSNAPSRFLKEIDPQYLELTFSDDSRVVDPALRDDTDEDIRRFYGGNRGGAGRGGFQQGSRSERRDAENSARGGRRCPAYEPKDPARVTPVRTPVPAWSANMKSIGKRLAADPEDMTAGGNAAAASGAIPVSSPGVSAGIGKLRTGGIVEHEKFGRGRILLLEDTPNGAKATVEFDVAGTKTLLLKYARLTPVE